MQYDFPNQVRIENTNHCNARCTICPMELLTRPLGTMGVDLFSEIIAQLVELGTKEVHLQGFGEPFLDKTIFDKIRIAKDMGIPFTFLVTNASLLNEENSRKLLASGLDKMRISFYGLNKSEYERVHVRLSFDEVRKNILRLLELKRELHVSKPVISLKYIGSILKFIPFFFQWGFKTRVSFARLHNYGYGRKYNETGKKGKDRTCAILSESTMQVLWDGRVVPCCYDFDGKMILGDLTKETVSEVWNGETFENFRAIHRNKEFSKLPICADCDKLR